MDYNQLLKNNRNFRNLWLGQLVSEVGDWFNNIALFAFVVEFTDSGVLLSLFVLSRHLPLFLFGPLAGVMSDRFSRRRIMLTADAARALLALSFLLIHERGDLWIAYAGGAALMVLSIFFNAAKRASLPNIASADELLTANSLSGSTTAFTIAAGSALGGIIGAAFGRAPVFWLNALSFIFSFIVILFTQIPQPSLGQVKKAGRLWLRSSWQEFGDGLSYIRSVPVLAALMWLTAAWSFGNGAARVIYAPFGAFFAGQLKRPEDFGIAALYVAMGGCGVIGALLINHFAAWAKTVISRRIAAAILCDGFCLACFTLAPNLFWGVICLGLREIAYTVWRTAQQTELMRVTADAMRGRVFAAQETISALLMMGTMIAAGPAIDRFGFRPIPSAAGSIIMLGGLWWLSKAYAERRLKLAD